MIITHTGIAEKITSNEAALKASVAMHPLGRCVCMLERERERERERKASVAMHPLGRCVCMLERE